jgi:ubiquinol-cytochrome c reductase cytochrome b subunit
VAVAATVSINPIWNYGPYDPSPVSAGTQPDFYIGFIDGGLRLFPGFFEFTVLGFTFPLNVLLPSLVIPGIFITAMVAYPFIEQWVTGDKREHHLADRPRNAPTRTGLGVMAIVTYCIMWAAAGNDLIATHFSLSINDLTWLFRIGVFVFPPLAFVITRRICLGLQRKDRDLVLHGHETGQVVRTADGEYFEVHAPLDEYERWTLVQHDSYRPIELETQVDEHGVEAPKARSERRRAKLSKFFFEQRVEPVTPAELAAAHHGHGDHEAIEGGHDQAVEAKGHGHQSIGS